MKRDGNLRKLIIHSAKASDSGLYSCSLADDVVTFHVDIEGELLVFIFKSRNIWSSISICTVTVCVFLSCYKTTSLVDNLLNETVSPSVVHAEMVKP